VRRGLQDQEALRSKRLGRCIDRVHEAGDPIGMRIEQRRLGIDARPVDEPSSHSELRNVAAERLSQDASVLPAPDCTIALHYSIILAQWSECAEKRPLVQATRFTVVGVERFFPLGAAPRSDGLPGLSVFAAGPSGVVLSLSGYEPPTQTRAMITAYPADLYDSQRLLFDRTRLTRDADAIEVPQSFYERGWVVIDGVADHEHAVAVQESLIASIDPDRVPSHALFADRVQLGKADLIPVCDDVVATSYQVLHFDMGLPFVESPDQLLVTHVGIYLPASTTHRVTARTRLLQLGGILANVGLSPAAIETRIHDYSREHGDGWGDHNSLRLACFVRLVDALSDGPRLTDQIDKTVGQWFVDGRRLDDRAAHCEEATFLASHGIEIRGREHEIALQPGQLLFVDNTRVVHGRIGERRAKEVFNFMFGVPSIDEDDVTELRREICALMAGA
jgi:hypothetical protein